MDWLLVLVANRASPLSAQEGRRATLGPQALRVNVAFKASRVRKEVQDS